MTHSLRWHPYAETYPRLEGEEYEAFKADLRPTANSNRFFTGSFVGIAKASMVATASGRAGN